MKYLHPVFSLQAFAQSATESWPPKLSSFDLHSAPRFATWIGIAIEPRFIHSGDI